MGYSVGLLAVIIGALVGTAVGGGLLFGGIFTLTGGCYADWDGLSMPWKFASVLLALAVFIVLGAVRARWAARAVIVEVAPPEQQARAA